jgi:biopolymer transport protein TolR
MRTHSGSALQAEINVTPLVDVCLVLLIIFMVVMPIIVNGVPVRLPEARTGGAVGKEPIQITVNADRTIYIDSVVIRADELTSELQRKQRDTHRPVVVRADKSLAYGDVVRVLDTCRTAGFENVGLATTGTSR